MTSQSSAQAPRAKRPKQSPAQVDSATACMHVVAAGAVGTGKSETFRNLSGNSAIIAGTGFGGVTKEMTACSFCLLDGTPVSTHDPVGVGDTDVTPFELMGKYEDILKDLTVDALLLFFNVKVPRFEMAGQMLIQLMDICFPDKGGDKWSNFVCVGTRKDLASDAEIAAFKSEDLAKTMRKYVPEITDLNIVCVGPGDYDELYAALEALKGVPHLGDFKAPSATEFTKVFSKVSGVPEEKASKVVADEFGKSDELMRKFDRMLDMDRASGRHSDEMFKTMQSQMQMMQMQLANRPEPVVGMPAFPCVVQ